MHRIDSQRKLSPSSPSHAPSPAAQIPIPITISNLLTPSQSLTTSLPSVSVGRNPKTSALQLAHPSISGSHAVFSYVNNHWTIKDVGSLNGTFLNKMRLEPHAAYRLSSDDVVHFGGDADGWGVTFSMVGSHSMDLSGTSFPRGSLSIAKSKSFCERLAEVRDEVEEGMENSGMDKSFDSFADGRVECGFATLPGRNKKESEDRHCAAGLDVCGPSDRDGGRESGPRRYLVGVFDGHCGAGAAEEAVEVMQEEMRDLVCDVHDANAYVRAFLATDERIEDEAGCTATCVTFFLQQETKKVLVRAANVGDSMAYLTTPMTRGERVVVRGVVRGDRDGDGDGTAEAEEAEAEEAEAEEAEEATTTTLTQVRCHV